MDPLPIMILNLILRHGAVPLWQCVLFEIDGGFFLGNHANYRGGVATQGSVSSSFSNLRILEAIEPMQLQVHKAGLLILIQDQLVQLSSIV